MNRSALFQGWQENLKKSYVSLIALTDIQSIIEYLLCFKCCRLNPWLDIEPLTCIYVSNGSKIGF